MKVQSFVGLTGEGVKYPVLIQVENEKNVRVENPGSCFGCMTCVEFCRASAIVVSGELNPVFQPEVFPVRRVINVI